MFLMTGADSLEYLSVEGLQRAVQFNMKTKHRKESGHCTACLTGLSRALNQDIFFSIH